MCSLTEKCWFWRWSLLISGLNWWIVLLERRIEFSSSIRLNAAADFLVPPDFDYFAFFGISLDPKTENWFWKMGPIGWTCLSQNSAGRMTYWDVRSWLLMVKSWLPLKFIWLNVARVQWGKCGGICVCDSAFMAEYLLCTAEYLLCTEREEGGMVSCS